MSKAKAGRTTPAMHARYDAKRTTKTLALRGTPPQLASIKARAQALADAHGVGIGPVLLAALSVGLESPGLGAVLSLSAWATPAAPPKAQG